jgi:uncharacterized protein (DUF885 family)
MSFRNTALAGCSLALLASCAAVGTARLAGLVAQVTALADEYVRDYFEAKPEQATLNDVAAPRHDDRLGDNSLAALERWRAKEDAWLAQVRRIDAAALVGRPEWVTHGVLRGLLETSRLTRVCREELWLVRHDSGWLDETVANLAAAQPVGSPEARSRALARWKDLGRFIEVEIGKLREGLRRGYTMPKGNVRRVITLVDDLLTKPVEKTFLFDPAQRAHDPGFSQALTRVIQDNVRPALRRYRDFLEKEYLPKARDQIAVAANPDGARCYLAYVHAGTGLDLDPEQVHRTGLQQIDLLDREMRTLTEKSFHSADLKAVFARVTTEKALFFANADEVVRAARESIRRAKEAAPRVFGLLAKTDVEVRVFEFDASDHYQQAPELGRPAIYWTGFVEPWPRVQFETIVFHETIPGHHLQIAIALERAEKVHPLVRYFSDNGFGEGWALYAERLADELRLFSDDLSRLGMLSMQAYRAARLVVDTGIHAKGWSRERAIEYMLAHTASLRAEIESQIDRSVGFPGQALGYTIGFLEIRRLREVAQTRLGPRFDLRQFHDRVLEDGNVNLPMLRAKVERWASSEATRVEGGAR